MVEHNQMKWLVSFALLATASAPVDRPRTYLASIVDLPLKSGESLESFSIATWGVEFRAICRIPGGWRIKAGSSATPDGVLEGEGSQGATWFDDRNPPELRNLVLVTLYGPIQRDDIRNGPDATFKGSALISSADSQSNAVLTYKNVKLIRAQHCP